MIVFFEGFPRLFYYCQNAKMKIKLVFSKMKMRSRITWYEEVVTSPKRSKVLQKSRAALWLRRPRRGYTTSIPIPIGIHRLFVEESPGDLLVLCELCQCDRCDADDPIPEKIQVIFHPQKTFLFFFWSQKAKKVDIFVFWRKKTRRFWSQFEFEYLTRAFD